MKKCINVNQHWLDFYFNKYKWYRKLKGGKWYRHQYTKDAEVFMFPEGKYFWARYGNINRYSRVVNEELW